MTVLDDLRADIHARVADGVLQVKIALPRQREGADPGLRRRPALRRDVAPRAQPGGRRLWAYAVSPVVAGQVAGSVAPGRRANRVTS